MAKCTYCGAEILFLMTANGKKMPCEAKKVSVYRTKDGRYTAMTATGEVIRCDTEYNPFLSPEEAFLTHWASCPGLTKGRRA
jgi:hypothetical protein